MSSRSLLIVIFCVAISLATASAAEAAEVFVTIPANANIFTPRSIIINVGDSVTWQYPQGMTAHSVVPDTPGAFMGKEPPASAPWTHSHTFFAAGTYPYHCGPHGQAGGLGMSGIIYVGNRVARAANEKVLLLNAWDFDGEATPSYLFHNGDLTRYQYQNIGSTKQIAGVELPAGAEITGLEVAGCNTVTAELVKCIDPAGACPTIATASMGAGCAFGSASVVNEYVDNLGSTYLVRVNLTNVNSSKFRSVRVFYKLVVSFPPATATFADVPTSHPFFRFVEALSKAGITGGCGGGNYCPDAPLTRGQMAVFLSAALGLHWPN